MQIKVREQDLHKPSFAIFFFHFLYAQKESTAPKQAGFMQNKVFLATMRYLLLLTKTSIEMILNLRHQTTVEKECQKVLSFLRLLLVRISSIFILKCDISTTAAATAFPPLLFMYPLNIVSLNNTWKLPMQVQTLLCLYACQLNTFHLSKSNYI